MWLLLPNASSANLNQWGRCISQTFEFGSINAALMSDTMAIRTEYDPVFQCVGAARALGDDVVSVARRFAPTASHAPISIPAAYGLHPCAFGRVWLSLVNDVATPLIPGWSADHLIVDSTLRRCHESRSVTIDEAPFDVVPVWGKEHLAATALTRDFAALSSLHCHHHIDMCCRDFTMMVGVVA